MFLYFRRKDRFPHLQVEVSISISTSVHNDILRYTIAPSFCFPVCVALLAEWVFWRRWELSNWSAFDDVAVVVGGNNESDGKAMMMVKT